VNRKHWIVAPLTAVVLLLSLAFGAGPASADTGWPTDTGYGQACNYDYFTFNACLNRFRTNYRTSLIAGIDLRMSRDQSMAALRRGSHFQATLYTTATGRSGIVLDMRSGWPQIGPYVLSVQFGYDDLFLDQVPGENVFQAEIVFTEVHADGSATTRTYKTGIIHSTIHV
jgi:hypothetical protein